MDDGSASAEETAQMLAKMRQQGVTTVAATPHFYADREKPEDFLQRRNEAFSRLPAVDSPNILLGAEVAYFPGLCSCDDLIPLQIGDTGLLLVEMPFRPWTDRIIADICAIPTQLGLTPVLAHIDRYRALGQFPKYRRRLQDNDVYFQCNAEAFEKAGTARWAIKQIMGGYLHFLGSDCHDLTTRAPNMDIAINALNKKLNINAFNAMSADLLGIED